MKETTVVKELKSYGHVQRMERDTFPEEVTT